MSHAFHVRRSVGHEASEGQPAYSVQQRDKILAEPSGGASMAADGLTYTISEAALAIGVSRSMTYTC